MLLAASGLLRCRLCRLGRRAGRGLSLRLRCLLATLLSIGLGCRQFIRLNEAVMIGVDLGEGFMGCHYREKP